LLHDLRGPVLLHGLPSFLLIDFQIMMPNITIRFCYYVPQL
jgi:hypothetical protein